MLIPMFEDLFSFIVEQNCDKRGNPLDADLKHKLNRYLVQKKKAIEDIKVEEILRIIGKCVVFGDFNVDMGQDAKKAEVFLTWADTNFLVPFTPELSTSLRSNRIIDYALATGLSIDIHNCSVSSTLNLRNTSSPAAVLFWSKCKKYLKSLSYTVHAFVAPSGHIIKDTKEVCEVAADFYENLKKKSNIVKPHPYTDSSSIEYDNVDEPIPEVTLDELVFTVQAKQNPEIQEIQEIQAIQEIQEIQTIQEIQGKEQVM
ncbi:unnamed protein product [Rotaria sordida]|uniref:Uncharacterized protein n=1 Tax=Rotaria sordida TaxID=392033 RepID=A0A819LXK6_9BILA|nr:unnamed protein product [Rotaria sordida]